MTSCAVHSHLYQLHFEHRFPNMNVLNYPDEVPICRWLSRYHSCKIRNSNVKIMLNIESVCSESNVYVLIVFYE